MNGRNDRLWFVVLFGMMTLWTAAAFASDIPYFMDNLDNRTVGKPFGGLNYGASKAAGGVALQSADAGIEYPAGAFRKGTGRIEFALTTHPEMLASPQRNRCFFSDVGSAEPHPGAVLLVWPANTKDLKYGIYDGKQWQWCVAQGLDWKSVGSWHTLAMSYGKGGMVLEFDGKVVARNDYAGGLADTPKRVGFGDKVYASPPVMIDSFRCQRDAIDRLALSNTTLWSSKPGMFDRTRITYESATDGRVSLDVVNKETNQRTELLAEKEMTAGEETLGWDGAGLADGEYEINLTLKSGEKIRKLKESLFIEKQTRWKPAAPVYRDYFPIGAFFWAEPDNYREHKRIMDPAEARDYYERAMADLAAMGFNQVLGFYTPPEHRKLLLECAARHGLKVIIHLVEVDRWIDVGIGDKNLIRLIKDSIKDVKDDPALDGYFIIDEPYETPDLAQRLLNAKQALDAIDPAHPGFPCVLLYRVSREFLKEADFQVLLRDIYPYRTASEGPREKLLNNYIKELEEAQAVEGNHQLWVIYQGFGTPNGTKVYMIPTPAEIRGQIWLALAYGAKGIMPLLYQSMTKDEVLEGIVDVNLKPWGDGRHEAMRPIHDEIKPITAALLKLKPAKFELAPIPEAIVAKAFTGAADARFAILVNKNTLQTVEFDWPMGGTDERTKEKIGPRIRLEPGAGLLARLP